MTTSALALAALALAPLDADRTIPIADAPAYGGGSPFRQCVIGELTGDTLPEAVVVRGGVALMLYGVGLHRAYLPLANGVLDVAVLHGYAQGGWDAVVVATSGGLSFCERLPGNDYFTLSTLYDTSWEGARAVRVGDVDGDLDEDIVGLSADGHSILVKLQTSPGAWGNTQTPKTFVPTVRDIQVLDYDNASSGSEIAVLSDNWLRVYYASGGPALTSLHSYLPGGGIAVLPDVLLFSGLADSVAWCTPGTGDLLYLSAFDEAPWSSTAVDTGIGSIAGLVAAQVRESLQTPEPAELVLVHPDASELSFAYHPYFDATNGYVGTLEYSSSAPSATVEAVPAFADLDNDATADMVFAVDDAEAVGVWFNESLPPVQNPSTNTTFDGDQIYMLLDETAGLVTVSPVLTSIPTNTNAFRILSWLQEGVQAQGTAQAVNNTLSPTFDHEDGWFIDFVFPVGSSSSIYYVELHPVHVDEYEVETSTGRSLVGAFARDTDLVSEGDGISGGNPEIDYLSAGPWEVIAESVEEEVRVAAPVGWTVAGFVPVRSVVTIPPPSLPIPEVTNPIDLTLRHSALPAVGEE